MANKILFLLILFPPVCYGQYNYHLIKFHPQIISEIGRNGNILGLGISCETRVFDYFTGEFSVAINDFDDFQLTHFSGKLIYYFSKKKFVGPYAGYQFGLLSSYYAFSGLDLGFQHFLNERWMAKGHVGIGSFLGWRDDPRNNYFSCGFAAAYMFKSRKKII